jgi:two-component system phosphate regulon sensor histidine kinase PhoR
MTQSTDDSALAFRRLGPGRVAGYVSTDASMIAGAAERLPDTLTLVRSPRDADAGEAHTVVDPQGNKLSVAFGPKSSDLEVALGGSLLVYRVVPRDPADLARLERRAGDPFRYATGGAVLAFVAVASVLFAQKRRAQHLANLRTDFVASVSHELRTPLASVRMLAELLEAGAVLPEERAEVERTLAGESRRLAATLERMLRFGALARGKLAVAKERTKVASLLEDAAERLRSAHPGKEAIVTAPGGLEAEIDPGLLALALDNLLANAAKYAPEGGPYAVAAREEGRDLVISVADRGPGLDRRAQARVFQPFERADDRLSRATEGTGVGLALVRGIARAHGGDALVTSTPRGGTTFALRIPRG